MKLSTVVKMCSCGFYWLRKEFVFSTSGFQMTTVAVPNVHCCFQVTVRRSTREYNQDVIESDKC